MQKWGDVLVNFISLSTVHDLNKAEHLIGTLVGIVFVSIRHFAIRNEILTPKLVNFETAFIDIEVDISSFKVWCIGLPNLCFGM